MGLMKYYLDENNSGGYWRLKKKDFDALLAAGWKKDSEYMDYEHIDYAYVQDGVPWEFRHRLFFFEAETIKEAVESFEKATEKDFFDQGCSCCGPPYRIIDENWEERISGSDVILSRPF
jgi:hypothetical protein